MTKSPDFLLPRAPRHRGIARFPCCRRMVALGALLSLALTPLACGPKMQPIEGKVVWDDGSPAVEMAGGTVVCESADGKLGARGEIKPDGSFRMSTYRPDDGLLVGAYKVLVAQPPQKTEAPEYIVEKRFQSFETSGLQLIVESKPRKDVVITIERAKSK